MNAADVIEIYTELERLGVRIWIDGGWGVDALLGRQTRPHADLDIAVEENNVQALRTLLERLGFQESFRVDSNGHLYPVGALGGAGEINGAAVRCVAPAFMVRFKTSYEPREIDRLDVAALRDRFGI